MVFSEKLRLLTHIYKVSNSKLARAIRVDASLVSRWKTGDRTISAQSPHLAALASFFVQAHAYPYQKAYLLRLLQSLAGLQPQQELDDKESIHILANWLAQADDLDIPPFPNLPAAPADPVKLLDGISSCFSNNHKQARQHGPSRTPASPAGTLWHKAVIPGRNLACEVFTGVNGKRQAVVNIMLEVLASQNCCEIYMVSEEHMNWLIDDPDFTRYWASLLQQVIKRGHKITVIHIVSRRTQEITSILEYWLPLHLTGQIKSFYNPKYIEPVIQQTLFIVRDQVVCYAQSADDLKAQGLTSVCRDSETISHYDRLYASSLAHCLPLLKVYTAQKRLAFQDDLRSLQEHFTRLSTIRRQLNPFLLPASLFTRLLHERGTHEMPNDGHTAEWLLASRERFMQKIESGCDVYDMIPLALLDELCQSGPLLTGNCELLVRRSISLSYGDMADWLEQISLMLAKQKSYHLYLYQEDPAAGPGSFTMNYYENQAALFAPAASGDPFIIMLREANILHSFGLFLNHFVARIPTSQRNREDVRLRLDRVIGCLRQKASRENEETG